MHRLTTAIAVTCALLATHPAASEDSVDHYAAEQPETLAEAVATFSEYNGRVADVLEKETLTVADAERIHELTYTLEVALAKINEAMAELPATLEELHLSSESHRPADVREAGARYLETARTVIP